MYSKNRFLSVYILKNFLYGVFCTSIEAVYTVVGDSKSYLFLVLVPVFEVPMLFTWV